MMANGKNLDELDELVSIYAGKLLDKIKEVLPRQPNEAEFRQPIDRLLEDFCQEAGLNTYTRSEYTLARGKADAVLNRFVIEYERPGTLSDDSAHRKTKESIEQVKKYISDLASKQNREIHRVAGVSFDGRYIVFVRYHNGDFSVEAPVPVSRASLERFLRWLASVASGIALTAENLYSDFNIEQTRTQNILRALNKGLDRALNKGLDDALKPTSSSMVRNLFEQWRIFFSESIDYSEAFGGRKMEPLQQWASKAGLTVDEAERFFFCLHTYFALLVKLIAWLALSRHLAVKLGAPSFGELVSADSETLRRRLAEMESGGIFRAYGITNLLEGDFFAWYLYAWNKEIEEAIRKLLQRLDEYDPATLTIVPEETRDLFKKLYHYLLPREIRHNLGEYYTPDWLAQHLLRQVDGSFFTADPKQKESELRRKLLNLRWLDPACGSGTFLVLIIARMRELGSELMVNEADLLDTILNNVVGFDLNPLAVITARVNYVLAIADILEHRKSSITIPVYLADSVRTPAMGEELFTAGNYEFPTAVGTFLVPDDLCTQEHFKRFCQMLEESIHSGISAHNFLSQIETELGLKDENDRQTVLELYNQLQDLHNQGLNGLWARLLKNNFAPLTVGEFDYVVGNPPWINWEHLPDGYRESTKDLWVYYKLAGTFAGGRPRLGAVKVDISALMTYIVADKLLKSGGRLGFVITQSVFKTAAGAGFRRFRIPQGNGEIPLRVVHVDDMVSLQPFEAASNRTAVFVLEKGKPTEYPVPYTVWRKAKGARFTYDSKLEKVKADTKRLEFVAEPVDPNNPTSPWLTVHPDARKAVRKVLGRSDYEAHAGAYTGGANAVYWVDIVLKRPDGLVVVRNITEGAKVKVDEVTETIEPNLLYPLLRGRDVQRWRAEPSTFIILVHNQDGSVIPESDFQRNFPRTYGYLKRFEPVLRQRRDAMVQGMYRRGLPFYSYSAVGTYTFAPWKVVWPNIASYLTAAVVGSSDGKVIVPQHIVTLVACDSEEEAHYLCALINSSLANFAAKAYSQEGGKSFGDPHILENIRIPRFDPNNPVHCRLADLSKEAHQAARREDAEELQKIEAQIDREAASLWRLTDSELKAIQSALAELEGVADESVASDS
jgi:methylase of polypeptide subunit release factors